MKTHTLIRTLSIVAVVAGSMFMPGPLSRPLNHAPAPDRRCACSAAVHSHGVCAGEPGRL